MKGMIVSNTASLITVNLDGIFLYHLFSNNYETSLRAMNSLQNAYDSLHQVIMKSYGTHIFSDD